MILETGFIGLILFIILKHVKTRDLHLINCIMHVLKPILTNI